MKKNYTNIYWGDGLAPVECQYRIICSSLDRNQFRRFLKDVRNEGIYYRHNWKEKLVVLAFESHEMMEAHANMIEIQSRLNDDSI